MNKAIDICGKALFWLVFAQGAMVTLGDILSQLKGLIP